MTIAGSPTSFFVLGDGGLYELWQDLVRALTDRSSRPVCVTGRAGTGKTALLKKVGSERLDGFDFQLFVDCRDQLVDPALLIDLLRAQLPDDLSASAAAEGQISLSFLRGIRSLVILDNVDDVSPEIRRMAVADLTPSKVLLGSRDAREFRLISSDLHEIEHVGLTREEMQQLFDSKLDTDPVLLRKVELASPDDRSQFLDFVSGWPQALMLACARLSTTSAHLRDFTPKARTLNDVYGQLLQGSVAALGRRGKLLMQSAAAFPATFTIDGLSFVTGLAGRVVDDLVIRATGLRLIVEVREGVYAFDHPVVAAYAKSISRTGRGRQTNDADARRYLSALAEQHGGQPSLDWVNFRHLDQETENLVGLLEADISASRRADATKWMRELFSYFVERGYWRYVASTCERMLDDPQLTKRLLPDWCIWRSWLEYYLFENSAASLGAAERALSVRNLTLRQRFEANRRGLLAAGSMKEREKLEAFVSAAQQAARPNNVDDQADFGNTHARSILSLDDDRQTAEEALRLFDSVRVLLAESTRTNQREFAVAVLGAGRCELRLGRTESARRDALEAASIAESLGWLRGIADAADLLADVNKANGDADASSVARARAASIRRDLRRPVADGWL